MIKVSSVQDPTKYATYLNNGEGVTNTGLTIDLGEMFSEKCANSKLLCVVSDTPGKIKIVLSYRNPDCAKYLSSRVYIMQTLDRKIHKDLQHGVPCEITADISTDTALFYISVRPNLNCVGKVDWSLKFLLEEAE